MLYKTIMYMNKEKSIEKMKNKLTNLKIYENIDFKCERKWIKGGIFSDIKLLGFDSQ